MVGGGGGERRGDCDGDMFFLGPSVMLGLACAVLIPESWTISNSVSRGMARAELLECPSSGRCCSTRACGVSVLSPGDDGGGTCAAVVLVGAKDEGARDRKLEPGKGGVIDTNGAGSGNRGCIVRSAFVRNKFRKAFFDMQCNALVRARTAQDPTKREGSLAKQNRAENRRVDARQKGRYGYGRFRCVKFSPGEKGWETRGERPTRKGGKGGSVCE